MLLFSYLTILDVAIKNDKSSKSKTRDAWLDRYEAIMDFIEKIELSENDIALVSGYDEICTVIDELCLHDKMCIRDRRCLNHRRLFMTEQLHRDRMFIRSQL